MSKNSQIKQSGCWFKLKSELYLYHLGDSLFLSHACNWRFCSKSQPRFFKWYGYPVLFLAFLYDGGASLLRFTHILIVCVSFTYLLRTDSLFESLLVVSLSSLIPTHSCVKFLMSPMLQPHYLKPLPFHHPSFLARHLVLLPYTFGVEHLTVVFWINWPSYHPLENIICKYHIFQLGPWYINTLLVYVLYVSYSISFHFF